MCVSIVPALVADAGEPAAWHYVEFFAANIRNPNTRRAYARACGQFFAWCEDRGLTLTTMAVRRGGLVEALQEKHGAPAVKQQLAAVSAYNGALLRRCQNGEVRQAPAA
jgi:hypothetical protein